MRVDTTRLCEVRPGGDGPGNRFRAGRDVPGSRWWAHTADVRAALRAGRWIETERPAPGISYWQPPDAGASYTRLCARVDVVDELVIGDWHGDSFEWFPKGDDGRPYWRLFVPRHPDSGSRT